MDERTQVAIVGAGPAGLLLGHFLMLEGIDAVVLERRSRDYVERRVRAGVLEQGTSRLLIDLGLGERMTREGLVHYGVELRFDGTGHRIAFDELTGGKGITIYGQQEVVKDLIAARISVDAPLDFETEVTGLADLETDRAIVTYQRGGLQGKLACDFVAGCDGGHGVCYAGAPANAFTTWTHRYPFAWLGILSEVAPSTEELIYAYHERGFALHSMRSPELSRFYVQCDPGDSLEHWPDDLIWDELHSRFACEGWSLKEGPIIERGITELRSVVTEPMQWSRLFLAGDAAHIVPATGAKGLNLAVADVCVLAEALVDHYRSGRDTGLRNYSASCLRRVWRSQHFAWWMTEMLHRFPRDGDFRERLQRSQLEYVTSSRVAAASLAENYVGFDLPTPSLVGADRLG